jgi:hypothetical protein
LHFNPPLLPPPTHTCLHKYTQESQPHIEDLNKLKKHENKDIGQWEIQLKVRVTRNNTSDFLSLAATGVDRRESMRVTEAWHLLWPLPVTGYVEVIKKFAFI